MASPRDVTEPEPEPSSAPASATEPEQQHEQHAPALPPRPAEIPRALWPDYTAPPPKPLVAPNRAIPQFLRGLAVLFALAALSGSTLAWVMHTIIRPRIAAKRRLLARLKLKAASDVGTYVEHLGALASSVQALKARSNLSSAIPPSGTQETKEEAGAGEGEALLEPEHKERRESLVLNSALGATETSGAIYDTLGLERVSEKDSDEKGEENVTPVKTRTGAVATTGTAAAAGLSEASALARRLGDLDKVIKSETPRAGSGAGYPASYSYWQNTPSATFGARQGQSEALQRAQDQLGEIKSEIRVLKGLLLSRRSLAA